MTEVYPFPNKMVLIGAGCVGSCVLSLLDREFSFGRLIVIDRETPPEGTIPAGAEFYLEEFTEDTYEGILAKYLAKGDVCCNLSILQSLDICVWCLKNDVMYVDSSTEEWMSDSETDPWVTKENRATSYEFRTVYGLHRELDEELEMLYEQNPDKKVWPTAAVCQGMNPGMVNQFMKKGLLDVSEAVLKLPDPQNRQAIERAREDRDYPRLAQALGVKVIHVAERDSQVTTRPRRMGEFHSTWSGHAFVQESKMHAELAIGTHEKKIPASSHVWGYGPNQAIALDSKGVNTKVFSWVPSGPTMGYLLGHEECLTMGEFLTIKDGNGEVQYRPTVLFSYRPCDNSIASLHELIVDEYEEPEEYIMLRDDTIIEGKDEVGILLLGHQLGGWWTGSVMSIDDAKRVQPGHSATTLQVAAGVIGALHYVMQNPNRGLCFPEMLDHELVLAKGAPYMEPIVSIQSDFKPLERSLLHFCDHGDTFGRLDKDWIPDKEQELQLPVFLQGAHNLKPSPFYRPEIELVKDKEAEHVIEQ